VASLSAAVACSTDSVGSGGVAAGAGGEPEAASGRADDSRAGAPDAAATGGGADGGTGATLAELGGAGSGGSAKVGEAGDPEYSDDFDAVGAWALVAVPSGKGDEAEAEIKDGRLWLFAAQGAKQPWACPDDVTATLSLPSVKAMPEGTTTVWSFELTDNFGSGNSFSTVHLRREPFDVTVDLVALPPRAGALVVRVADGSITTTFDGEPVAAIKAIEDHSGTPSIEFRISACGADLGAEGALGVSQLEIRTE
jgi:hypothetical protein